MRSVVRTVFGACVATPSSEYGRGFRKSRSPPRRAQGTLQLQDESVIVGYYTLQKVQNPSAAAEKERRNSMARNDGIDRTFVRNRDLKDADIAKAQEHNEREKEN